jgi:hypothetical protein
MKLSNRISAGIAGLLGTLFVVSLPMFFWQTLDQRFHLFLRPHARRRGQLQISPPGQLASGLRAVLPPARRDLVVWP